MVVNRLIAGLVLLSLITLLPFSVLASAVDLSGHWAEAPMLLLAGKGVLTGYGEARYFPDRHVTRAEFSKMLVLAMGYDPGSLEGAPPRFRDVPPAHWAHPYIEKAADLGVIGGYEDGNFRPDTGVSRAEAAVMMMRALGGLKTSRTGRVFQDQAEVPEWARGAVAGASAAGIVQGYEDGTFRPARGATRAEISAMLVRLLYVSGRIPDISGVIQAVDLDRRSLTVRSRDGSRLRLTVPEGVPVFRQGARVALDALKPLDEFQAVVDPAGRLSFLDVRYADAVGRITEVNPGAWEFSFVSPGGARPERVRLSPEARIFRNDSASRPEALQPGDRVYVVYDSATGEARIVDALRVDLWGILVRVTADPDVVLTVDLHKGGRRVLRAERRAAVLVDGSPAPWTGLASGDTLAAVLDESSGKVVRLEALRRR